MVGDCLTARIQLAGHRLKYRQLVANKAFEITETVSGWSRSDGVDVVITNGGTGLEGQYITIEILPPLFQKTLDGFSVLFHKFGCGSGGSTTQQFRACAGLIDHTFVFCLPGSAETVKQIWDDIIRDALDSRYRPSSLVDLIPRLNE